MTNENKPIKKGGKRLNTKYPALRKEVNPRTRYELIDYDYLDKLSPQELEWLNDFSEEYIHAHFDHGGKKIHTTPEQVKDCYDRNNSRNRCVWTIAKAAGLAGDMEGIDVAEVKYAGKKKNRNLTVKKLDNEGKQVLEENSKRAEDGCNLKAGSNRALKNK